MFIVFEGIDGTGKTTQARMLNEWLTRKGNQTLLVREPGETVLGKKLRKIILEEDHGLCDVAELGLYLVDRAEHIDKVVKPALEQNIIVISDRYVDSTVAYQCYGKKIFSEAVTRRLNGMFSFNVMPDKVFVLDMDAQEALDRVGVRGEKDNYESKDIEFFFRAQTYYRKLRTFGPRYSYLNANQEPEELHNLIKKEVQQLLL